MRGSMTGGERSRGSGAGRATGSGRKVTAFCSACEAPLSQDEMLMSSATEGRCVTCQQFAEGHSACRVCHLPWGEDSHSVMACDACGFYMHDSCVKKGALQTRLGGRLYTYCPHCPPALPSHPAGGRVEASGSLRGSAASDRGGRASQNSLSLAAIDLPPLHRQHSAQHMAGMGAQAAGGGRLAGGGGGPGAAALAPLALPAQSAQMQQVAAMLQGQLRMLQTQEQQLLRQYEQNLRGMTPEAPPTAYSLFQLDMFRVYQEEGFEIDPHELQPIISNAWHQLTPDERAGYDSRAQQGMVAWSANAQLYTQLYHEYETLASHVGVSPDTSLMPKALTGVLAGARQMANAQPQPQALVQLQAGGRPTTGPGSGRGPGRPPGSGRSAAAAGAAAVAAAAGGGGGSGRGVKRPAMDTLAGASALLGMNVVAPHRAAAAAAAAAAREADDDDDDDEDYEAEGASKRARRAISPAVLGGGGGGAVPASRPPPRNTRLPADKLPTGISDLPQQLTVSCNDVGGTFIMDGIKVLCHCKDCIDLPKGQREFHPTHWEQHCGAGTAKKWKASIKIEPGGAPEVPSGGNPMQIGKWFDMLGVEFRPAKTTGGPPVLEFTGATIRRLEAEGGATTGNGTLGGPPQQQQQAPLPPQSREPGPLRGMAVVPGGHPQDPPPSQQQQQQLRAQEQPPAAAAPPGRPPRPMHLTPPPVLRGSTPPTGLAGGGGGGAGGGGGRRADDGPAAGTTGGASKPPRLVSDGGGFGYGDKDAEYCPGPGSGRTSAAVLQRPPSGSLRDGGYDGESSSRGSASDTLGPNTTT